MSGEVSFAQRHHTSLFLVLAYAWTWTIGWSVVAFQTSAIFDSDIVMTGFLVVGASGPTLMAIYVEYLVFGKAGATDLWHRIRYWPQVSRGMALTSFFLMPFITAMVMALYVWFGGPPPETKNITSLVSVLLMGIFVGSPGEEVGWRGVLGPRVQIHLDEWFGNGGRWTWSPLVGCVVTGITWACWHLPSFFVTSLSQNHCNFGQFLLQEVLYCVFYTYVSNKTNANILVAIAMHTAINSFGGFVPWGDVSYPDFLAMPNALNTVILMFCAAGLIFSVGPQLGREDFKENTVLCLTDFESIGGFESPQYSSNQARDAESIQSNAYHQLEHVEQ